MRTHHWCCSCCFRARLIIVTERHHSVVFPRRKTSKSKIFGESMPPLPLIKSAYALPFETWIHFCHFPLQLLQKIHRNSLFFSWYNIYHVTDITTTCFWFNINCCHLRDLLRVLYLPAQQNNMSAHWACTPSVFGSPISIFWNGRHPRSFHQVCGPNIQIWIQWTTKFAQKCSSRSTWEKFVTWTDWH